MRGANCPSQCDHCSYFPTIKTTRAKQWQSLIFENMERLLFWLNILMYGGNQLQGFGGFADLASKYSVKLTKQAGPSSGQCSSWLWLILVWRRSLIKYIYLILTACYLLLATFYFATFSEYTLVSVRSKNWKNKLGLSCAKLRKA